MRDLYLFNTISRKKERFVPLNEREVRMYHCGPTVYWRQHIGNLRSVVMADILVRTLRFFGYSVILVRNYTDVGHLTSDDDTGEDKMSVGARRESKQPEEIAATYISLYKHDVAALNVVPPTYSPRATEHIKDIIAMVETLLKKGYAYATPLAIYFDTSKARNYTRLSGQCLTKNKVSAGSGEVSDPNKRHPSDFALWFFKAGIHARALQTWPSPFSSPLVENGEGFPGWHIECSAMARAYLGDTIDIHMGGVEHIPIHHTNEIAQSEAVTGKPLARYWIHNEHLLVQNAKMSKSEGTSITLSDIEERGFDPMDLRYFFLGATYRSKQNFTWSALAAARTARQRIIRELRSMKETHDTSAGTALARTQKHFTEALSDDLNTPKALAVLFELLHANAPAGDRYATALLFDQVLGLRLAEHARHRTQTRRIETREGIVINETNQNIPQSIIELIEDRFRARRERNWSAADKLRDDIAREGWMLADTQHSGTEAVIVTRSDTIREQT